MGASPLREKRETAKMLSRRAVQAFQHPQCIQQVRGMATLKEIRLRLKSVTNIQKITKSMKMVSAAKFSRAERELKAMRPYGEGATSFYDRVDVVADDSKPNQVIVGLSSDRGLCGGVHSTIAKAIKADLAEQGSDKVTKLVIVGDKAKLLLQKQYAENFLITVKETGRLPPSFQDASIVCQEILGSDFNFDSLNIYYNKFKSVISYDTVKKAMFSMDSLKEGKAFSLYDSLDDDILECYNEYTLANLIYFGMKEQACSEQSARMTAMDSASKNASEMIDNLTLTFNRTRQAAITRELIEIISGAAAL